LAREWSGARRERLLGSGDFTGDGARWVFAGLDGEQRLAVRAIEKIDETLFRGLRNRIDIFFRRGLR